MADTEAELAVAIRAKDEASNVMNKLEKRTSSLSDKFQKHGKMMGMAFTAAGVAGLKMIDSAKKMNAELGVTAIGLGVSTAELRNLALETTNVTFPLKEVTASFDLLTRAGLENMEQVAATATAFDTLGDAINMGASQVTKNMVPAMKTFDLTADEMIDQIDKMTYLTRTTTLSLDDFNTMVGYTTPELVRMGLEIDDLTAILIHMEKQGFAPGRVMTREFQRAVTEATKSQIPLTEAIGLTAEELAGYKRELEGAAGMAMEYAEEANKQYGIMDKLKQKFSELTLQLGSYLEPLEPVLAGMTALGPIMMVLSTSIGIATVKWIALTAATIAGTIATKASSIAHGIHAAVLNADLIPEIKEMIAAILTKIGATWSDIVATKGMILVLYAKAAALKIVAAAHWVWNTAIAASRAALITLNAIVGASIALLATLAAGLAMVGYGIYELNKWSGRQAELDELLIKLEQERIKLTQEQTNEYDKLLEQYIKMRESWGYLSEAETKFIAQSKEHLATTKQVTQATLEHRNAMAAIDLQWGLVPESIARAKAAQGEYNEVLMEHNNLLMEQFRIQQLMRPGWMDFPGGKGAWTVAFAALALKEGIPWEAGEMKAEVERAMHGLTSPLSTAHQGGEVTKSGAVSVLKGETILPKGATITIPIYLDGELIAQRVIELTGAEVNLQGVR